MADLVLVRHGQASLLTADYDRLSELGQSQARELGQWWADHGVAFDTVFTGPAVRHRETARLAGEVCRDWPAPVLVEELDEHDAFAMVGKALPKLATEPEIAPLAAQLAVAKSRRDRSAAFQRVFEALMARWLQGELELDGVESWPRFRDRVERGLDRITGDGVGRSVVAFTSVGPIAVALRRVLGTTDLRSFETAWRVRNASLTRFVFSTGRITLDGFNALPHLTDPQTHTFR